MLRISEFIFALKNQHGKMGFNISAICGKDSSHDPKNAILNGIGFIRSPEIMLAQVKNNIQLPARRMQERTPVRPLMKKALIKPSLS
jgi:hypothetical protein